MKLKRGPSSLWRWLHRVGLARAPMPFWRVVVEARLVRGARKWPRGAAAAVTAVFVWARTIEEAEALSVLALEAEGLKALTADAKKCPPAAAPKRTPMAVARTEIGFIEREPGESARGGASRSGARA